MVQGYQAFLKEQAEDKRAWQRVFETWAQATMERVEQRASQEEGRVSDGKRPTVEGGVQKHIEAGESEEVISVVLLQHKERILDEVSSASVIWQLQAESWARRCTICRVRDGRRRSHDWRDCDTYPEDREAVRKAHGQVQTGTLSMENAGNINGTCGLCTRTRQHCWMQIKHSTAKKGCRCSVVITES